MTLDAEIVRRGNLVGLAGLGVVVLASGRRDRVVDFSLAAGGRHRIKLQDGSSWDADALELAEPWPAPTLRPQPSTPGTPWARQRPKGEGAPQAGP